MDENKEQYHVFVVIWIIFYMRQKMYFSMKFNELEGKTLNTRQIVRSFIRQFWNKIFSSVSNILSSLIKDCYR